MDIFDKLKLEAKGISGLISSYTGDPYILSVVEELCTSVKNRNIEETVYLLEKVNLWYEDKYSQILRNSIVINKSEHARVKENIKDYIDELKKYNADINKTQSKDTVLINNSGKPRIFIGSSVEGLSVAKALQIEFEYDTETTVWYQGIFQLSSSTIEDLINSIKTMDFAIFVFTPDDIAKIRDKEFSVARDNVVFELGLSIGLIGRKNVFYILPRDCKDFHLPTDMLGITPGEYNANRSDGNIQAAISPIATKILEQIKKSFVQ